ncbi:V-type proton ATPase subunit S1 [Pseudolycoriella hygida]|uniref:V-type proton ATPase subunit S1 n=1 Tax=Pseudolycoriella hygida TaxID=35572 RepID=A0A9Q0MTD9_9DIPT|nr:V-type proton ATPase subunit S1 [Pseudolycoriella hygida]
MLRIATILCYLNCVLGNFIGPFVFWGRSELQTFNVPALESVDDRLLRNLYSESTAVVMFLRNSSNSLNVQNYPKFKDIIDESQWTYFSQHWLSSDPIDYNTNTEVYNLIGEASEQDTEIDEIYKNAIKKYGAGKVLGILATKSDNHDIYKRENKENKESKDDSSTVSPTVPPTDETMKENLVYMQQGKVILYMTVAPKLFENGVTIDLHAHGRVTIDEREGLFRMKVFFFNINEEPKLFLQFEFKISNGYWSLTSVNVQNSRIKEELYLVGQPITAPLSFSYKCAQTIVFRNNVTSQHKVNLTLQDIQVQPSMNGHLAFGDAYDCVGFTTAPIWSGIFVTSFISAIIMLGLLCILEIKPPNKFENNRGKQLTFTVQE